jgi:hypothetical protein
MPHLLEPANHAQDFARRWADRLDTWCALRMEALGIPLERIGAADLRPYMSWCAFDPEGREGGSITSGIVINSGVLNPHLLVGRPGSEAWARARLRDRIDAVIAHEYEESQVGTHKGAIVTAPRTTLPISPGARSILQAMAGP